MKIKLHHKIHSGVRTLSISSLINSSVQSDTGDEILFLLLDNESAGLVALVCLLKCLYFSFSHYLTKNSNFSFKYLERIITTFLLQKWYLLIWNGCTLLIGRVQSYNTY